MDILSIILIGVGLAMDCLAVSITKGLTHKKWGFWPLLMAVLFGVFQGGMPLIGYFAGTIFASFFSQYSPWIALLLLGFIGGKMIKESLEEHSEEADTTEWGIGNVLLLAIATSIDALATGVIFIPVPQVLWLAIGVIAITSFAFATLGYLLGMFIGNKFKLNVELLGGLILIGIGLKIFIEGVCLS